MSRSAADATRFTATAPHAYSKPASFRSAAMNARNGARSGAAGRGGPQQPPSAGGAGGGGGGGGRGPSAENAKEKVARLRAAHAAKKAAEITTWDRVIIRGRSVADTAHRVTVMGLVGLSIIAGAVTVYSIIDLSMYNRRKKREWLEKQYENLQKELVEASRAEKAGIATPEQMLLLNRERAAEQAKQDKENRKGVTGFVKDLFTTEGLKKEETIDQERLLAGQTGSAIAESIPIASSNSTAPGAVNEAGVSVTKALDGFRRQGEKALESKGIQGGSLDQFASSASEQVKKSASSWSSWLGFGSK